MQPDTAQSVSTPVNPAAQSTSTPINPAAPVVSVQLATLANQLLLLGQAIAVATKDVQIIIAAAYIKLFAGALFVAAAYYETQEQQISPGVTTPLNRLKLLGASGAEASAILLTYVLQQETALKAAGIVPPTTPTVTPFIGGVAFA